MVYISDDKRKIDVSSIVFLIGYDYYPYFNIRFLLRGADIVEWSYETKEARDREMVAIYNVKNSLRSAR